ncbi:MAG: hypothetical protein J1F35_08535 [Erysipelotrichales bacterium]|nr:hypothetical protein [Erysipelotrichales bacterium]
MAISKEEFKKLFIECLESEEIKFKLTSASFDYDGDIYSSNIEIQVKEDDNWRRFVNSFYTTFIKY